MATKIVDFFDNVLHLSIPLNRSKAIHPHILFDQIIHWIDAAQLKSIEAVSNIVGSPVSIEHTGLVVGEKFNSIRKTSKTIQNYPLYRIDISRDLAPLILMATSLQHSFPKIIHLSGTNISFKDTEDLIPKQILTDIATSLADLTQQPITVRAVDTIIVPSNEVERLLQANFTQDHKIVSATINISVYDRNREFLLFSPVPRSLDFETNESVA